VLLLGGVPLAFVPSAFTAAADGSGVRVDLVSSVCAGMHTARVHPADPAAARAFITASRTAINALNGTVTLRQRAPRSTAASTAGAHGPPQRPYCAT
jgi:hypothetical protein